MKYFIRKTAVLWVLAAAMLVFSCKGAVKPGERTIAVTGVSLNKTELSLVVGSNETLTATVEPATATNKAVTWKSSKPDIAEVDETGKVTAKQVGTATITVTTKDGGKTATCEVKVLALYSITYELNGGTANHGNPIHYTVETLPITLKPAEKEDRIFAGWYENEHFNGMRIDQLPSSSRGNKILYAKFLEGKTYEVENIHFNMINIAKVENGTVGVSGNQYNNEHIVSLTAYQIGETEVTQELWQAVMGKNPSFFDNTGTKGSLLDTGPVAGEVQGKRPVESINWYECITFCNKLSLKAGLTPCYTVTVSGSPIDFSTLAVSDIPASENADWNNAVCDWNKNGFRLPTEAEWEWAAQGGPARHKYPGTNEQSQLENYLWHQYNSSSNKRHMVTHEVKKKAANGYGLYDMGGNVRERCWDWYDVQSPEGGQDPIGASLAGHDHRVVRGSSYFVSKNYSACADRSWYTPAYSDKTLGLRLVRRS